MPSSMSTPRSLDSLLAQKVEQLAAPAACIEYRLVAAEEADVGDEQLTDPLLGAAEDVLEAAVLGAGTGAAFVQLGSVRPGVELSFQLIEALAELEELAETLCVTLRDHLALPQGVDHCRLPLALPEQVWAQETGGEVRARRRRGGRAARTGRPKEPTGPG